MLNDPLALSYPSMVVTTPELQNDIEVEGVSKSQQAEEMAAELMQSVHMEPDLDITELAVDTTTAEEPQEVREQYGPEDSEESCEQEDDDTKRVMELASRAASVPAVPVADSDKYIGLVAERKIISLENKLMQVESELRQALKDLARYKPKLGSPRRTGTSVSTQTSTIANQFVDSKSKKTLSQRAQAQGSPLLPSADYNTYKKFVRGICYRFLPGADYQDVLQKWFGRESDAVRHFQATYLLTPTMVSDLCKHVSPVISRRSTSASPSMSRPATSTTRRRSSVPRSVQREESPSRKKVAKRAKDPTRDFPKLKVSSGATVIISGAPSQSNRGLYLGKDDRGLACVRMFGFRDVSRIHPKDIKVEKSKTRKGIHPDVYNLSNKIPVVPGDEVLVTNDEYNGNHGLVLKVDGDYFHVEVEVPRIAPNKSMGNTKRWGSVDNVDSPSSQTPRSELIESYVTADQVQVSRYGFIFDLTSR